MSSFKKRTTNTLVCLYTGSAPGGPVKSASFLYQKLADVNANIFDKVNCVVPSESAFDTFLSSFQAIYPPNANTVPLGDTVTDFGRQIIVSVAKSTTYAEFRLVGIDRTSASIGADTDFVGYIAVKVTRNAGVLAQGGELILPAYNLFIFQIINYKFYIINNSCN